MRVGQWPGQKEILEQTWSPRCAAPANNRDLQNRSLLPAWIASPPRPRVSWSRGIPLGQRYSQVSFLLFRAARGHQPFPSGRGRADPVALAGVLSGRHAGRATCLSSPRLFDARIVLPDLPVHRADNPGFRHHLPPARFTAACSFGAFLSGWRYSTSSSNVASSGKSATSSRPKQKTDWASS